MTAAEFAAKGLSREAVRWMVRRGEWTHAGRGLWAEGPEPLSDLDRSIGAAIRKRGVVSGRPAGVVYGYDGLRLRGPEVSVDPGRSSRSTRTRRRALIEDQIWIVDGVCITSPVQTLLDLAADVADDIWEQALESALRKRLVTIAELEAVVVAGARGVRRIRRVLALRPPGAPPTESLLETLMVQLIRTVPGIPAPTRQVEVFYEDGRLIARVDLAWPELGLFIELDGEHHADQPVYDASRETAVVAATGWLCGRFTWTEVVRNPRPTARKLARLAAQARRRPLPAEL